MCYDMQNIKFTILSMFQLYHSVVLSTFTLLSNHHHYSFREFFKPKIVYLLNVNSLSFLPHDP